ncbi:hypothetical protein K4L44_00240 [Halosquirtibacter laminarini]|uniref:Uncharacterized protein n=1 Tax=Halosquirtibacter laminarini TaxID=3374600 RepID=A0AC61NFG8_9BACT|nr:hypothetical protein K4L44_00240 [Prolixibacteraceae bacterium]
MTDSIYITKDRPVDEVSLESLKQRGIELIQQLSGNRWTDYNLHDPGITVLEQVCYAITEMLYISRFGVVDLLSDSHGDIHLDQIGLYAPIQVFPTAPITEKDYRKIIYDQVPGVYNVWVNHYKHTGLFSIEMDIFSRFEGREKEICDKAREVFLKNRNLGEDILDVSILEMEGVELYAEIEVDDTLHVNNIVARIYFECAMLLFPGIAYSSYHGRKGEKSLDQILSGVALECGCIDDNQLQPKPKEIQMHEMFAAVQQIKGVVGINHLKLRRGDVFYVDRMPVEKNKSSLLILPKTVQDLTVKMTKGGKTLILDPKRINKYYQRLRASYFGLRNMMEDIENISTPIKGNVLSFGDYHSIQNHFPAVYGLLNAFPIGDKRFAETEQLRGYLLFFDRILANFFKQTEHLSSLFNISNTNNRTYYNDSLYSIPGIEGLLRCEHQESDINHFDRANRFLDFLLSLHGESFSENLLSQFNFYYSHLEVEEKLIERKQNFLKNIIPLNRDKASTLDYTQPLSEINSPAILQKIRLLLDIEDYEGKRYTDILRRYGMKLHDSSKSIPIKSYLNVSEEVDEKKYISNEVVDEKFLGIPLIGIPEVLSEEKEKELFDDIVFYRDGVLEVDFLINGVFLDNYRLGKLKNERDYVVVFKKPNDSEWLILHNYNKIKTAIEQINRLRYFLIKINRGSEGVTMIDNILLRPQEVLNTTQLTRFSHQVSFVFPNWSSRFSHIEFRKLVEETVQYNLPAHILPHFYWLEDKQIDKFQDLYHLWFELKRKDKNQKKLDEISREIVEILRKYDR